MKRPQITQLILIASFLLGNACGMRQPKTPNENIRSDYYALLFNGSRFNQPKLAVQLLSDSVTTVLDSVVLRGLDETYAMWKKLAANASIIGASRTIQSVQTFGDTAIKDHGKIRFERSNLPDTTMSFSTLWHRERYGWRITLDSVRSF